MKIGGVRDDGNDHDGNDGGYMDDGCHRDQTMVIILFCPRAAFMIQENYLWHTSEKCVKPVSDQVSDGVELGLYDNCEGHKFGFTKGGSLKHLSSGKCVQSRDEVYSLFVFLIQIQITVETSISVRPSFSSALIYFFIRRTFQVMAIAWCCAANVRIMRPITGSDTSSLGFQVSMRVAHNIQYK